MRILVFGDSIVRGAWDTECGGWTNRLSALCSQKSVDKDNKIKFYSLGIGGETVPDLAMRLTNEVNPRLANSDDERIIIIQSGLNDAKYLLEEKSNQTDVGTFKTQYKLLVQASLEFTPNVFCLGLTQVDETHTSPIPPNNRIAFRNSDIADYTTVIKGVAREFEVGYIEMADVVTKDMLVSDGIHPNSEGHQRIFEKVKSVLESKGLI